MASPTPSENSSGTSSSPQICADITDMRKRKRMLSNRESARRSRMRKQRHVDDLTAQMTNLRAENNHILINTNITTQLYLNIESENSILRAQISELSHRLHALEDIITCIGSNPTFCAPAVEDCCDYYDDNIINGVDHFFSPRNLIQVNHPIMASPHDFMY